MFEMYIKFWLFRKNDDPNSLSISEIIESKRLGYLNVWKFLFQGTLQQSTCLLIKKTD